MEVVEEITPAEDELELLHAIAVWEKYSRVHESRP
jgi:hypothetical protein